MSASSPIVHGSPSLAGAVAIALLASQLLGKANWWLLAWLDKALPTVGFEGAGEELDVDREMQELTAQAAKEV
jgi:hypothetical protein